MSPHYFTRLFKEATGKSPHQFIIEAKVSKARYLLERGNISIGEAAYEVGFVDQSHLTPHFKRAFGLPPKAFLCKSGLQQCLRLENISQIRSGKTGCGLRIPFQTL